MKQKALRLLFLLLALMIDLSIVSGQVGVDLGKRPIRNFTPSEYGGYSRQIWTIAQSKSGLLYFGNESGVLEFDGVNWNLIPAASGTTIRCLAISGSTLYVGGKGDFGYLEKRVGQSFDYVSLSSRLELRDFSDVWSCAAANEAVFFLSSKMIFRYHNNKVDSFGLEDITGSDENDFYSIFSSGDHMFLSVGGGNGLYQFQDNAFKRLDLKPNLPSTVVSVFDHPSLGLIALTSRDGLFKWDDDKFESISTDADSFLKSNRMYDGMLVNGNEIALSSTTGGVVVLDKVGKVRWDINEESGLNSNSVYDLLEDRNQNIWMATEYGISMSESSSPYAVIDRSRSLRGAPYDVKIFDDQLLIGSSDGLFVYSRNEQSMISINNDRNKGMIALGDELLVASYGALYLYKNNSLRKLSEKKFFVRSIKRSEIDPEVILIGTPSGLEAIRRNDGRWNELGYLAEFNGDATSIIENAKTKEIFIGTDFRGLVKVIPNFENPSESEITIIDENNGLPNNDEVRVRKIDSELRLLTNRGIYKLNGNQVEKDDSFDEIEFSLSSEFKDLLETPNGVWGGTWENIAARSYVTYWYEQDLRAMPVIIFLAWYVQ